LIVILFFVFQLQFSKETIVAESFLQFISYNTPYHLIVADSKRLYVSYNYKYLILRLTLDFFLSATYAYFPKV